MLRGFRDFVLRGNVIDLAVAVVIGTAFGSVVTAIAEGFISPLIALVLGGAPNFDFMNVGRFGWGTILGALINFVITAAVIYFFIVAPTNRLMARFHPAAPAPQPTRPCPECMSNIPVAARRCAFCTTEVPPVAAPMR